MMRPLFYAALACLLAGCNGNASKEFGLEIADASIFDIGYIDYSSGSDRRFPDDFKIGVSAGNDHVSGLRSADANANFFALANRYENNSAGISVTFDLCFSLPEYNSWLGKRRKYLLGLYGRDKANDPDNYKTELGEGLLDAFGRDYFQKVNFGEIDLKNRVLRNCTVYGVIYNDETYKNRDFKLVFDKQKISALKEVTKGYTKEVVFNYDRLTVPDYRSMDGFIASLKNTSVKRSFNSPYKDLFRGFVPSSPRKGHYMFFYERNPPPGLLSIHDGDTNPAGYEGEVLKCTGDPNEAQFIIYEKHYTQILGYEVRSYVNGHLNSVSDSHIKVDVSVYDIKSQKIIYTASYGQSTPGKTEEYIKNIADEISCIISQT
jgi:hypothetical protein